MALVGDGVLAVTEGVPQLDGAVTRARDDLSVVGGEGYGENVVGVADESSGGGAGSELPQTESLVPRSRQGVSTVRGDNLTNQLQSASRTLFFRSVINGIRVDVHSRTQCESDRVEIAWGNRTGSRRG